MTEEHRAAVGTDLGGTNLKFALVAGDGRILARQIEPTRGEDGYLTVLDRIAAAVRRLAAAAAHPVAAVGVGLPADLDAAAGVVRDLPNLPGRWREVPVAALLAAATGLPTHLINDAKAFALAEQTLGAARGARIAVCVTIGTGIGSGIVLDGRVLDGAAGLAGEIGHAVLLANSPVCTCGNRGCTEAPASGLAIAAEAVRRIHQGFTTDLPAFAGGDLNRITPELVAQAADGARLRRGRDRCGVVGVGSGARSRRWGTRAWCLSGDAQAAVRVQATIDGTPR